MPDFFAPETFPPFGPVAVLNGVSFFSAFITCLLLGNKFFDTTHTPTYFDPFLAYQFVPCTQWGTNDGSSDFVISFSYNKVSDVLKLTIN